MRIKIKKIILILLLISFFIYLPSQTYATSWFLSWVGNSFRDAILAVPTILISTILVVSIVVSGFAAFLSGAILSLAISPKAINLSYTNPAHNQIIQAGLAITQPLANIILVIALVVVALSIALRIGEYGSKKTFVRLIVVAILINFAPLFCGLIVDAANIIMYYFLNPIRDSAATFYNQIWPFAQGVINSIWGAQGTITNRLGVMGVGVSQIMVNVAVAIAFLLFAILFLFRYIVIWLLVILSPLAFASFILPGTKLIPEYLPGTEKFWDLWLKQLIEWSMIGIVISFFLYLGLGSFSKLQVAFLHKLTMPGISSDSEGILNNLLPYGVVITFLYIGFFFGLQTQALGGKAVINAFSAAHKVAQGRTLRRMGRAALGPVENIHHTYRAGRRLGLSRPRAAGEAASRWFRRRTPVKAARTGYDQYKTLRWYGESRRGAAATGFNTAYNMVKERAKERMPSVGAHLLRGTWNAVKDVAKTSMAAGKAGLGMKSKRTCPHCGGEVPAGAHFCPHCGTPV